MSPVSATLILWFLRALCVRSIAFTLHLNSSKHTVTGLVMLAFEEGYACELFVNIVSKHPGRYAGTRCLGKKDL